MSLHTSPNYHASQQTSLSSVLTSGTQANKRTDSEKLPPSLFPAASQASPRRFFHATHEGQSAAPAHTATSAYKPSHNHSCSPRPSPNATLPQPTAECKNPTSALHDGLNQQAPHYASRTTHGLLATSAALRNRTPLWVMHNLETLRLHSLHTGWKQKNTKALNAPACL